MRSAAQVEQDERAVQVENAGYRFGYLFTVFALLLAVMYRSWFRGDAAWDLLAIVIASGILTTAYRLRHDAFGPAMARWGLLAAIAGAAVAVLLVVALLH